MSLRIIRTQGSQCRCNEHKVTNMHGIDNENILIHETLSYSIGKQTASFLPGCCLQNIFYKSV